MDTFFFNELPEGLMLRKADQEIGGVHFYAAEYAARYNHAKPYV